MTPTEDLLLELLIARHRLGEAVWTVSTTHTRALTLLEDKGLVSFRAGIVEKTYLVSLTAKGIEEFITGSSYTPPILQDAAETIANRMEDLGFDANVCSVIRKQGAKV